MAKFKPFKNPRTAEDTPLVTPYPMRVGEYTIQVYRCTGCGEGNLPSGLAIYETLDDKDEGKAKVIGLKMVSHQGEGEVVHECGVQRDITLAPDVAAAELKAGDESG
jgi:hypothetical protein